MKIEKGQLYKNLKGQERYIHDIVNGNDGRLVVVYSKSQLDTNKKECLYGGFLSWITK